jgi:hypothetical protein
MDNLYITAQVMAIVPWGIFGLPTRKPLVGVFGITVQIIGLICMICIISLR